MAKQKIFLHAGMHKTGTTAFQTFCTSNAERLKEMGFLYPHAGKPTQREVSLGHHLLPWFFTGHVSLPSYWPRGDVQSKAVWDELETEIKGSGLPNIVLSSEEFDTLTDDQIDQILEFFKDFELNVIIYLRRLDDFAQAMYTTEVVHYGERGSITEFLRRIRTPLDYAKIVRPWSNRPDVKVSVKFFTPEIGSTGGITTALCEHIGIDLTPFAKWQTSQRVNVGGWPWYLIEACRQLNERDTSSGLSDKLARIMRICVGSVEEYDLLSPAEQETLQDLTIESLSSLAKDKLLHDVPDYFLMKQVRGADSWKSRHEDKNKAWQLVLDQIHSTLTVRSRALEQVARAIGKADV